MGPRDGLREYFGFDRFRPGQEAALGHVLGGRDALVVMPTGAGKSLIYQLAALLLPGTALVVSPLVALMKDQVDRLARRGIAATFINSSLAPPERARRLEQVAGGRYKLVFVAPERFRSRAFRTALAGLPVSLLAVDEAHCVSAWGHDFRPDYLHLAEARRALGRPVTLALTATATPRVQADITRLLGLTDAERLVAGFDRANLRFGVCAAPDTHAKLRLLRTVLLDEAGAGIVYTGTRADADEVAEFVREVVGRDARAYHGGLGPAVRAEVQERFLAGQLPLVVATSSFGMGIDRPDVRVVVHYTLPGTIEAYYQEAGRAGRDGRPARATLLYSPGDVALHELFIRSATPTLDELRAVHTLLRERPRTTLDEIAARTGLPQTKARLAIEQLESAGGLRRGSETTIGHLEAEARPLAETALEAVLEQVEARAEHRRQQLVTMVDWVESGTCRRRALLGHFGDPGSARTEDCCDNCAAPGSAEPGRARTPSERAALTALEAVQRLPWEVGRGKLASLLLGSGGARMARYKRARHWGKLAHLEPAEADSLVEQLLGSGHLTLAGGALPVVQLTPRGEAALKAKLALPVSLPRLAAAVKPGAEAPLGGTGALQVLVAGFARALRWLVGAAPPAAVAPGESRPAPPPDPIAVFLATARPRPLAGPWLAGWALDLHSRFEGARQRRRALGELLFRFKYDGQSQLAPELAAGWADLLAAHPELPAAQAIVPIPPSTPREVDPVTLLAEALAARLALPVLDGALVKRRATAPQKAARALAQKRANVAGAFAPGPEVRGKQLLLVDDLYDSGATLAEAARGLTRGGASGVVVLTVTKTIHADA